MIYDVINLVIVLIYRINEVIVSPPEVRAQLASVRKRRVSTNARCLKASLG